MDRKRGDFTALTALITGASSGIGRAFAHGLAEKGCSMILISEDEGHLKEVRNEISRKTKALIETEVLDLREPACIRKLFHKLDRQGKKIDILINCAGMYTLNEEEYTHTVKVRDLISLHIGALSELCLLAAGRMKERGTGYILNISSITSFFPDPASLTYGPSKRYIFSFSRSLACDLEEYGIRVTCMIPGGVDTGFFSRNRVFVPEFVMRRLLSPDECARAGLDALVRGRRFVVPGWTGKLQLFIFFLLMRPKWYKKMKQIYLKKKYNTGSTSSRGGKV